jgi:malonyl CoA-acyl carrier protein transacylase
MPRYFFNVSIEGTVLDDPDGQVLPNADAAWDAARKAARNLMATKTERPVNWMACRFEVRDEDDEIVLEFPFVEAVETKALKN